MKDQPDNRKIIHLDMDAFYASVEQRGVVAAASYEARQFGVRSAMASSLALRKCPDLIFVRPRFEVYKAVSTQIRAIFTRFTELIEPLSLGEAYLDVTDCLGDQVTATQLAQTIKDQTKQETGLTASAGVSYNKFLAKLASDYRKPDGLFVIKPHQGLSFVESLQVGQFHGIGRVTAAKMNQMGLFTGVDLRAQSEAFLVEHFGKVGHHYYSIARAIDTRPVMPNRERKSVGKETTFEQDLTQYSDLATELQPLISSVWQYGVRGRTVTLKVKYADFKQITRSRTTQSLITDLSKLTQLSLDLLLYLLSLPKGVRLLGISLSSLQAASTMGGASWR